MCSLRQPQVQGVEPAAASNSRGTLMRLASFMSLTMLLALGSVVSLVAQGTLTPQDRAEIQELSANYARTLGTCAAEEYADLFVPETGYFASNIRGEVVGRERLIALVRSERHCIGAASAANAAPRAVPTAVIEMSSKGPVGRADLGEKVGRYDDEYVKTPKGWRFAARTVITPAEKAAGLDAKAMLAIRRLASGPQDADDFWAAGQDGVKRFRSSGVVIGVSAGAVTGRVYQKDGGYYDDVYEKTGQGNWRFKSRVYVADNRIPTR